ncbi:uncharacterized protein K460DRAFT_396028 [Cucurbitaria berberidis CBS 394.84]|uniref:Fungal N-terminal domain-containing protein n=1 Tax=Cucurbitaria berberidis CBS 394.84 TaxID=1168544 RepID=A0A9P4GJT2_9PLEO|nr:uncharacterized protein K460DRAFT_396028 [Cucurbitaria berberidis CBS 394.84]KAF1846691.1 hypothetical protein K460DRAFT_396028 [Cucurbitaria berberidis CBS 394.84]
MSFGVSIGDIFKVCELAGRVYKNCRDCTGEYKALTTEARSLSNLLEDIQDKYDKIPENKRPQLIDAYEPCTEVLEELDKLLLHYNSLDTKSKRAWDRLKWDPEKSRMLRERLTSSVSMLNMFYTSLIHDSQVLILDALERLENDYRGGHREESIASIERITSGTPQDDDVDDDAAWAQILRDLQDVGVSQQEALSYRDVIIDWLVTAVNEGRLLEQPPQHHRASSMPQNLGPALPYLGQIEEPKPYRPKTLAPSPGKISCPAPSSASSLPLSQDQRGYLSASVVSLSVSGRSSESVDARSPSSDADASSLYAQPQPSPIARLASTREIRRVPVPLRNVPSTQTIPTTAAFPPSMPPASVAHPAYFETGTSATIDLEWNAQQIVGAWSRRDFHTAERLLEDHLAAVERGQSGTAGTQPDRRILRHLIGVCASFTGNFMKAKGLFDSVFNGIYLNRGSLDDGDVAAARWLGDVCLHLREHHNAVLAYSVAFEGSIGRLGVARDRTRRVSDELRLLDHWLYAFKRMEQSFQLNHDPTDIFTSTHGVEKSNLIISVQAHLYATNGFDEDYPKPPGHQLIRPSFLIGIRPKTELVLSENFLLRPLISLSAWPFPWDPTFSPADAVQLDRYMNTLRIAKVVNSLVERPLPTTKLGDSKKLHYVTKRGSPWLIETVKAGLREIGIEHAEHGYEAAIVCCLNQHRDGFAFSEGVKICFTKLQFRNVYGIKITDVYWATRRLVATTEGSAQLQRDTSDFRNMLKGILERVEADRDSPVPESAMKLRSTSLYPQSPHTPRLKKRATYG